MKFNKINMVQWDRREHFEHYFKYVKCGFSITENIDITKLR
jgi:chloramphenicol O-acetyltransferase type A